MEDLIWHYDETGETQKNNTKGDYITHFLEQSDIKSFGKKGLTIEVFFIWSNYRKMWEISLVR